MSALGLIRFFKIDKESFVTLTENGKDFFKLENPIFDGEFELKSFSDEEVLDCYKAVTEAGYEYFEIGFRTNKKFLCETNPRPEKS